MNALKNSNCRPLSFFSRKLTNAERKCSAYDRELLAAYFAIKRFRYMLDGRICTSYTDHKPLTLVFHQCLRKASPRQFSHLDFIGQINTDIKHISRRLNIVTDALSRINKKSNIDYTEFRNL